MNDNGLLEAPLEFHGPLGEGRGERERDTLNLLPHAEALADAIHNCETPVTIGVQGPWGSGKTSLLNMLRGVAGKPSSGLLQRATCQLVSIESWPYARFNEGNSLVLACLQAVTRQLQAALATEAEVDQQALQEHFESAVERLREAAKASATELPDLLLRFRAAFGALVALWASLPGRRRVVVFIDDLDRLRPSDALLLLEAVKDFLHVAGSVFVVALDFDLVQHGMAQAQGEGVQRSRGKSLYDKLVQLPFVMPVSSCELPGYLAGLLRDSGIPLATDLLASPGDLDFMHHITLCTVGRNPRNIKRVLGSVRLLLRIRERRGAPPPTRRDVQVLFALVCMQVAWPELYRYFVNDPSVDTVTSLQNWAFLDRMPEAQRLFAREHDVEAVKIHIATYFDTLFTLLDQNGDGQIEQRELGPVLEVMTQACLSGEEFKERPREVFLRRVRENNVDQDALIETFLDKVFTKSTWYLGSECRYRLSGTRYVTLVWQGQQIGSLVTLRSQPLVFRLAMPPERILGGLKAYWKGKHEVRSEAITFTRSVFGKEASMTGFGDTVVDYSHMTHMPAADAIGLLNALFRIVTGDELPEWELEREDGRKR